MTVGAFRFMVGHSVIGLLRDCPNTQRLNPQRVIMIFFVLIMVSINVESWICHRSSCVLKVAQ